MTHLRSLFIVALPFLAAINLLAAATPPGQPATGPGGADYAHAEVRVESHGQGADQYWLYLPDSPRPTEAPVVIFTHGWGAMEPVNYEAWLRHLARKGNVVIYPRYQASLRTPAKDFVPNAVAAVRAAFARLESAGSPVKPDRTRVATAGHSAGGLLAANLGVALPAAGLPTPRAIFAIEPAKSWGQQDGARVPVLDLSRVDPGTLLIALAGEDDRLAREIDAKRVFKETTGIPLENKDYIVLRSDDHGSPALVAGHRAPGAPLTSEARAPSDENASRRKGLLAKAVRARVGQKVMGEDVEMETGPALVDALDYYGTWKLLDALCDAAFYGKHREIALGGGPRQTFMGTWSDGTPVAPLRSTKTP